MANERKLEGLRGWLIVVGRGVVFAPIAILVTLFPFLIELFQNDAWGVLTTPGSATYNPWWAPVVVGEMAVNAGLVCAWVVAAVFFFTKRRAFPKLFSSLLLVAIVFVVADAAATRLVLPDEPMFDDDTRAQFGRTLMQAVIWVPYMLRSRRVKATFTRGGRAE